MKSVFTSLLTGIVLLVTHSSCMHQESSPTPWPEPAMENRPWTRWWWPGSEVDRGKLEQLLPVYAEAGFGGLEITPIYGVQGHEEQSIGFLSPEWMDMLELCISRAGDLGMGMDMNLGTGWPFGGPQITPELAASRLVLQTYHVEAGGSAPDHIVPEAERDRGEGVFLETLMARSEAGQLADLTGQVGADGNLDWTPGPGTWDLYAVFCGKTRQLVKRAAPGGEGFSMDHFSTDALDTYLARFDEAFRGKKSVRAFFNDSYEVYHASWTPGLLDEFLKRRGYDLREHLDVFAGTAEPERTARVKSDYRRTLSELLLEHFTRPWTEWSHGYGSMTRNQAHGSPGNLIDLYAAVDIPECEIFGHRDFDIPGMRINTDDTRNVEPNPMMLKLATSAAHVSGKPLVSNETFTWLGEHFKVALSQCKPEVEEAFLAGINHVFYHGTCYSPSGAGWPGWLFYASVHFGPTNSFWPHLKAMNRYITRCQSLLQSGKADNEVLVYWPVYDIWDREGGLELQLSVHNILEWLVYPGIEQMGEMGYSYDFISDALLEDFSVSEEGLVSSGGASRYQVLVIPACRKIPLSTLRKALELAEAGGLLIFEELPVDVPGYREHEARRDSLHRLFGGLDFRNAGQGILKSGLGAGTVMQCGDLHKALEHAGIGRERIGDMGLKFTRRNVEDGKIYYLVNHGPEPIDEMVPLNTPAESVLIMDPQDGRFGSAAMESGGLRTRVRVQLRPGRSLFLRVYEKDPFQAGDWAYEESREKAVEISGSWKLTFRSGGPALPETRVLDRLSPWTGLGDPLTEDFSGTAAYEITFPKPDIRTDRWILDLGDLHESARVKLNGKTLGVVWSLPHELIVEPQMLEDENHLVIEVANLMANRIRHMDREGIPWKIFHDINIVNIAYEPFNASSWETEASGLAGPVRLIPVNLN